GYLVMHGQLELGAMVAFLSAQEKLFEPWKELIDFYQTYQDASVRYSRTMGYFNHRPDFDLTQTQQGQSLLTGDIEVNNLVFDTPDGHRLLDGISFSLGAGEHLALVGFSGSGKSTLIQCLAKMFNYTAGSVTIDDRELSTISKSEIIRNVGYVSQSPFIFTGSIEENLLYAHEALPLEDPKNGTPSVLDVDLDRMILVLQQVGLFIDVMRFGLDSQIDQNDRTTSNTIVRIRKRFRENFGTRLADYIEFYNRQEYHFNSSVAENIIFGTATTREFSHSMLSANEKFHAFLQSTKLQTPLLELGADIARQAVDILSGLDNIDIFFSKSPVPPEKIRDCEILLNRLHHTEVFLLSARDKNFLFSLALDFIPSIHTMIRLPDRLKQQILQARAAFPGWIESINSELFIFYSENRYIEGQTILNNILFGRVKPGIPAAQEIINQAIMHLLVEEDYLEKVAAFGMNFQVGTMGDRLSGGQRQKLAIARVLLKQPKIILMDEATSALDNKSQARIQRLMTTRWKGKRTVIAAVHRLDIVDTFDKIAVIKGGKMVEFGPYQDLLEQKGILHELIYGKQ
ncbi:MAG: ATP-binding cassette domain-containing protein, partial [Desulforhopalus sp.]